VIVFVFDFEVVLQDVLKTNLQAPGWTKTHALEVSRILVVASVGRRQVVKGILELFLVPAASN